MKIPQLKVRLFEDYTMQSWSDYVYIGPEGKIDPKQSMSGIFRDHHFAGDFIGAQREPNAD